MTAGRRITCTSNRCRSRRQLNPRSPTYPDRENCQDSGSTSDRIIATAILDRVLHHAITINIRGNSYRLKDKLKAGLVRAEEPATIN